MYGSSGRVGPHLAVLAVLLAFGCTPEPSGQDASTNTEDKVVDLLGDSPPQAESQDIITYLQAVSQ